VTFALASRLDARLPLDAIGRDEPPAADPDAALVERFCGGDRAAFDEIVRRYQRPIYRLALRYVGNAADAADVTQRTFVRALEAIGRFRGAARFRTWLYRIAINLAINHLRDHRRERPAELPEHALRVDPVGARRMVDGEETATLRAAIARLPPKQRLVIELRVYDELPFREVAELADCSENSAKVNFQHALRRLRELLGEARRGGSP
jgi:RNA polymerase sigma-70 factor (ECF subfamily)